MLQEKRKESNKIRRKDRDTWIENKLDKIGEKEKRSKSKEPTKVRNTVG